MNLDKNQRIIFNFTANRKFTSCYIIEMFNKLWEKIYVIFIERCMKGDPLPVYLKRK